MRPEVPEQSLVEHAALTTNGPSGELASLARRAQGDVEWILELARLNLKRSDASSSELFEHAEDVSRTVPQASSLGLAAALVVEGGLELLGSKRPPRRPRSTWRKSLTLPGGDATHRL